MELLVSLEKLGFPNYQVSSLGKVYNIKTNYILKGTKLEGGYIRVYITNKHGNVEGKLVHVLVASAFYGVPKNMTVDHINRNRDDNTVWNLRWANRSEQNTNKNHYSHKGTPVSQYDMDGNFVCTWEKIKDAAASLNLSPSNIITARDTYKSCGGYLWKNYNETYENENWKLVPFPEYVSVYASNYGRIGRLNGKITSGYINNGYYSITLYDNITGKQSAKRVHRLIASAFLGINNLLQVNHKDGNKLNNKIDNLEYVTAKENSIHAVQSGLRDYSKGHAGRKCKVSQLDNMGNIIKIYDTIVEASYLTGISKGNICSVCKGARTRAGGYVWKYVT